MKSKFFLKCKPSGIIGRFLIVWIFFSPISNICAQEPDDVLPRWQDGYMDIHHINTGMGDCTFFVFPDGTTMLFDAGEMDLTNPRTMGPRNS
ncbi:MAG: hypothetical protein O6939_08525, partial [Bacteroidetes bacterium]|nr:hypothetical protein [Bacteroidota bacterium]